MSDFRHELESLPELVSAALQQGSDLLRNEVALARTEVTEKIAQVGRGGTMIMAGAIILTPALTLILFAIALGFMGAGMPPGTACMITGVGSAIVAGLIIWLGMGRLSAEELKPRATIDQVRRDGKAVREMVR
jgi:Putative Actinobacterial Holin-X, holin superfamily III